MIKFKSDSNAGNFSHYKGAIMVKKPKDVFITEFDDESIKRFKEDFYAALDTGQNIIPVYIDSPGGDVTAVLGMVDIIKSSPVPVATIALGFCASAGTILLSSGSEGYRYAAKHTQLMLHDLSAGIAGKEEEIKIYTKFLDKLQEILYGIYDDNTGHPKGTYKRLIKKGRNLDMYIDVKKAKEINLINHIGIPTFNFDIKINMEVINHDDIIIEENAPIENAE